MKKRVYFLRRADDVGPVKIGCSMRPEARLRDFLIWSPEPLKLLCSAPGGFAAEKAMHLRHAERRLHGEWFEATRELLSDIAKISISGELPVSVGVSDRDRDMAEMYKAGSTLQEIGNANGVSRERARQILRKIGIDSLGRRTIHKRKRFAGKMDELQEIAQAADVTEAYARMLLAGTRKPSLGVALKIYDATGEQLGPLAGLPKGAIKVARQMAA